LKTAAQEVIEVKEHCSLDEASKKVKQLAVLADLTTSVARDFLAKNNWSLEAALEDLRHASKKSPSTVVERSRTLGLDEQAMDFAFQTGLTVVYARDCLFNNGRSIPQALQKMWNIRHQLPAEAYRRFPRTLLGEEDIAFCPQCEALTIGLPACLTPRNVQEMVFMIAQHTGMNGEHARDLLQHVGWDMLMAYSTYDAEDWEVRPWMVTDLESNFPADSGDSHGGFDMRRRC
jgi:hypothetical protein